MRYYLVLHIQKKELSFTNGLSRYIGYPREDLIYATRAVQRPSILGVGSD